MQLLYHAWDSSLWSKCDRPIRAWKYQGMEPWANSAMVCFINRIMPRLLWDLRTSLSKTKLTSLFSFLNLFFYRYKVNTTKSPKHSEFFNIICFETSLPYRHLTYRPRFHAAWKDLCIACIAEIEKKSQQASLLSLSLSVWVHELFTYFCERSLNTLAAFPS